VHAYNLLLNRHVWKIHVDRRGREEAVFDAFFVASFVLVFCNTVSEETACILDHTGDVHVEALFEDIAEAEVRHMVFLGVLEILCRYFMSMYSELVCSHCDLDQGMIRILFRWHIEVDCLEFEVQIVLHGVLVSHKKLEMSDVIVREP